MHNREKAGGLPLNGLVSSERTIRSSSFQQLENPSPRIFVATVHFLRRQLAFDNAPKNIEAVDKAPR